MIPDKSASNLKMLVRPMWGSISSRLYVPEMENLGRCKSRRLQREPAREPMLSGYMGCSHPVCGQPELWEEVFPRRRGIWSYHNTPHCTKTFQKPRPPFFSHLAGLLCLDLRRLLAWPCVFISGTFMEDFFHARHRAMDFTRRN